MIDREDAERMLSLAHVDFQAVRNMMDAERFADSVFGFHAQQAVEKALKAWLSLRSVAYPKTHDLTALITLLETRTGADCGPFLRVKELTDFAVPFRYAFLTLPEPLNRPELVLLVGSVLEHVKRLIEDQATI
ncbi:MAG: HEPN domain-containing protein [Thermodesulfobacteriota bacterium]